jgi:hydroxyacylglutathione hydrolase
MPYRTYHALLISLMIVARVASDPMDTPLRVCVIPAGMSFAFAVESDSGLFLIDAGSPGHGKAIVKRLTRFSAKPLRLIIVTHAHFDHYGSADELRTLTGAPIAIHKDDAEDMAAGRTRLDLVRGWGVIGKALLPLAERMTNPRPTRADILLSDGDSLNRYGLPGIAVHTPGHTPGSITVLLRDSTALVSDLLVSSPWLGLQCYYATNWSQLAPSFTRVMAMGVRRAFTGHSSRLFDRKSLEAIVPKER